MRHSGGLLYVRAGVGKASGRARGRAVRGSRLYHISRLCTEIYRKLLANSKERWLLDKALGR
eukprot:5264280-Prymnesium_polylepis.1